MISDYENDNQTNLSEYTLHTVGSYYKCTAYAQFGYTGVTGLEDVHILSSTNTEARLINVESGFQFTDAVLIHDERKITQEEFDKLTAECTFERISKKEAFRILQSKCND